MSRTVWKTEIIFRVYELAKTGMTESKMAKVLGISLPTFRVWETKKKVFRMAVRRGRRYYKKRNGESFTFRDYVYKRLPKDVRKVWEEINQLDKSKSGVEKIESLLVKRGKRIRQHLFFYAWTAANFSISSALRKVNLSRSTFDLWMRNDPDFAKLVEEIDWHKHNFFEDNLCKLVAGGDSPATVFANRTFNRHRGYNDKTEVDVNLGGRVDVNFLSITRLKLPIKIRKVILEAVRIYKKENSSEAGP